MDNEKDKLKTEITKPFSKEKAELNEKAQKITKDKLSFIQILKKRKEKLLFFP